MQNLFQSLHPAPMKSSAWCQSSAWTIKSNSNTENRDFIEIKQSIEENWCVSV